MQKRELLARVKDDGDGRSLPLLKQLKSARGCGLFGRSDCWACMRREGALEEALVAVEARAGTK
jgi:hypothetical protein